MAPPATPVAAPPDDDGKTTDDLIRRLGREVPPTKSPPETPPSKQPPENPPTYTPEEPPPPHTPEEPPTKTPGDGYRTEKVPPCCGLNEKEGLITFPATTDPMLPPAQLEAARDPAVGGLQVFLHDGAFFANAVDVLVPKFFYNMEWTRHYRSDATFKDGGLNGHGWDFFFNKRLVPFGKRWRNGLNAERYGQEIPKLTYYSGTGRAEVYAADPAQGGHSEIRTVRNFDEEFRAYVSTYASPPGMFHQFERYVLLPDQPHPFIEHPNVEKEGERIFYVLREKDGTRYVFNCRGQLIYILSRNDSPAKRIRVELRYREPLNALTQNPMLYEIVPSVGKAWTVDAIDIGEGEVATNLHCTATSGIYPKRRVARLRAGTVTVDFEYKDTGDGPELESVVKGASDPAAKFAAGNRRWRYAYDGGHRLTELTNPGECAKGSDGKPWLRNVYAGDRVQSQTIGDAYRAEPSDSIAVDRIATAVPMSFTFRYAGDSATVTDAKGNRHEYALERAGGYPVVAADKLVDADASSGGPWTTRFKHNGQTQVTEITFPAGNGVTFEYEAGNKAVTLGPIRDWVERNLTYESNLARGNLLGVTRHEGGMGTTVTRAPGATYSGPSTSSSRRAYEDLYNQLAETRDANGNVTTWTYPDYDTPKHRGNPLEMQDPPVLQPDGSQVPRPATTYAYDAFAQHESATEGGATVARYEYNEARYIRRAEYRGGAFENLVYDALGNIVRRTTQDGVVDYARDALGQVRRKTVDPGGLALATEYEYDLDGNVVTTLVEVKDTFGKGADAKEAKDLGLATIDTYWHRTRVEFDILGREQSRRIDARNDSDGKVTIWGSTGDPVETLEPPRDGREPFKTTYRYDARHLVRSVVMADGTGVSRTVRRDYDDNGNLTRVESGTGADAATSTMHFNGLDRIDLAFDSLGAQRNFVYDAAGNLTELSVKDASGPLAHMKYAYNAYQQVIQRAVDTFTHAPEVSKWHYGERLTLAKSTSPNGSETTYDYDAQDRLEYVTDALGNRTRNVYDRAGHLVRVESTATERSRDAGGRVVESRATSVTSTIYDSAGRVVSVATPAGRERRFLDSLARSRGTVSATGQLTTMLYDGLGRQTDLRNGLVQSHKDYTPGGLVRESTGPDGNFGFTYDALGRIVSRTDRNTGASMSFRYEGRVVETTDGNGTKVRTTYNGAELPVDIVATPGTATRLPGDPAFAVVQGATREHFDYDGLGRITRATTGGVSGAPAADSASVARRYDGLGRLVEDQQAVFGDLRTVKYDYADDFSWMEVVYPDAAGGGRYRYRSDKLGRIDETTLDGAFVAGYDYTGLDRMATRRLANGVSTRFGYDGQFRLNDLAIVRSSTPSEAATLWRAFATYDNVGYRTLTEFSPGGELGDVAYTTYFKRDPLGRITSTTTGLMTSAEIAPPPKPAATKAPQGAGRSLEPLKVNGVLAELSGTFNVYDGPRLAAMAEYGGLVLPRQGGKGFALDVLGCLGGPASCVQGAPVRSMRVDRFAYGAGMRIDRVTTSGAVDGRVQSFPNGLDAVAGLVQVRSGASDLFSAGSRTPPTDQAFTYDRNGNLIDDGRYRYAYDFKNRLVLVQDSWAPNGYDEYSSFLYDPLDRRVVVIANRINRARQAGGGLQFNVPYTPSSTRLVYEGERVIADLYTDTGAAERSETLVARYFHGARPGELVRMDGRPSAEPKRALEAFYVHEDLNGSIRFVTDGRGRPHGVENEAPLTVGRTGAEAAPRDRNVIAASEVGARAYRSSDIRLPYLGNGTRIDGFAGTVWSDESKQPVINWRGAPNFVRATERRILADERLMLANQMQATVGIMVALPVSAALTLPATLATEVTWTSLGASAVVGGLVQTGFGVGVAWANGFPPSYGLADAGADFLQGATFGLAGRVVGGMGLSAPVRAAGDLAASAGAGVAWGVARSGRVDLDTVLGNTVMAVAMQGAGSGIGYVWRKAGGALKGVLFDAAETSPLMPAAIGDETLPPGAGADIVDTAGAVARLGHAVGVHVGVPITDELRALTAKVLARMEASRIPLVMEAVQRMRAGALKVRIYGKGQNHPDVGTAMGKDTSSWYAYVNKNARDILWVNADRFATLASHDIYATSILVHETIHAAGGNEICAFFGQARYLIEAGVGGAVPSADFQKFVEIYVRGRIDQALHAIGAGPEHRVPGGIYGYARRGEGWIRNLAPDPWAVAQHGWARALLVPHAGFDYTLGMPPERIFSLLQKP